MPVTILQKWIVVAFDMCSSTTILEQLILRREEKRLDFFWAEMMKYLEVQQAIRNFEIYKFMGDGWLLLFPSKTKGDELLEFLADFSKFFRKQLYTLILKHLDVRPDVTGLTVGLETGQLRSFKMNGRKEYVGRPINIACRLVKAIKDKDSKPAYKALASRQVYNEYFEHVSSKMEAKNVRRQLHNVSGGENFRCKKMTLIS